MVTVDGESIKAKPMKAIEEEAEVSSAKKQDNDDDNVSKLQSFVSFPDVQTSRWPSTRVLKEGEILYSMYKDFFLSGMRMADPCVTITAIYQCTRVGHMEKARCEVFEKQIEVTRTLRSSCSVVFAWHGTSAKGVDKILAHGFGVPSKSCSGVEYYGFGVLLTPLGLPSLS